MSSVTDFSSIPFVIFHIFHSYLSHYDYRQLMNANKSVFLSIKYETVYYSVKLMDNVAAFAFANLVQNKVKDSSVQVSLNLQEPSDLYCEQLSLFKMHKLSLSPPKNCAFSPSVLFALTHSSIQSLNELHLSHLTGFSSLSGLPSSLVLLFLDQLPDLTDISEIRQLIKLRKCSVDSCDSLTDVSYLRNILEVVLTLNGSAEISSEELMVLKNGKYEKFTFSTPEEDYFNQMESYDISFLSGVSKELIINTELEEECNLSCFCNVEKLSIRHGSLDEDFFPLIKMEKFHGKSLSLYAVDLSSLEANNFTAPNLQILSLDNCINVPLLLFSTMKIRKFSWLFLCSENVELHSILPLFKHLTYVSLFHSVGDYMFVESEFNATTHNPTCLLKDIRTVELELCDYFIYDRAIENIKHLVLKNAFKFANCSTLSNLTSLRMENVCQLICLKD
jgi:hypothetical protein